MLILIAISNGGHLGIYKESHVNQNISHYAGIHNELFSFPLYQKNKIYLVNIFLHLFSKNYIHICEFYAILCTKCQIFSMFTVMEMMQKNPIFASHGNLHLLTPWLGRSGSKFRYRVSEKNKCLS